VSGALVEGLWQEKLLLGRYLSISILPPKIPLGMTWV